MVILYCIVLYIYIHSGVIISYAMVLDHIVIVNKNYGNRQAALPLLHRMTINSSKEKKALALYFLTYGYIEGKGLIPQIIVALLQLKKNHVSA